MYSGSRTVFTNFFKQKILLSEKRASEINSPRGSSLKMMILSATKDSTALHKDRQVTAVDELIQEEKKEKNLKQE